MEVRLASSDDVETYFAFAREAQAWIQSRGLAQYIPAAHDEYAVATRTKAESGLLYVVTQDEQPIAFFGLDALPSAWWPEDGVSALYLSGMVIAKSARGRGVGGYILGWCAAQAKRLGRSYVRLDCHADNPWLCQYYERHGFELERRLEQHPGYYGCLYQRRCEEE